MNRIAHLGKSIESRTHIVVECALYQEERDVLEGEMRDLNKSGMKSFDALDSRKKTIAILGDRWWPQAAKQDGDKICRRFLCSTVMICPNSHFPRFLRSDCSKERKKSIAGRKGLHATFCALPRAWAALTWVTILKIMSRD